jgi:hypothetical protein
MSFNRLFILLCCIVSAVHLTAQGLAKQIDSSIYRDHRIIPVDKAELLKKVNLIFNLQYANNSTFTGGSYTGSAFALNQFRMEIIGEIFPNVFFRFRDRYTREPVPQTVDNTNHSVDMAFIDLHTSKKLSLQFGKMSADYGGYEFEANPIYIYQYNDIIAHADDFLVGTGATWKFKEDHELTVQLLNARTQTFAELYDSIPGVSTAKFPFLAVANWRGSFAGGKFTTFWSFSVIEEARSKLIYYWALGNQLHLGKWLVQYDFKINPEGLDRTGVVTSMVPKTYNSYTALRTFYFEHWLHVEYALNSQWRATMTGMSSSASWYGNPDPSGNDHLRTDFGVIPSIEFYPYKKLNLKFFTAYIGRYYDYTSYSKYKFGSVNSSTGVFEVGFSSPLVIL